MDARGQHQATPLHWAAFHGNDEMAEAILRFGPPLEVTDADFHGTPLGWAIHGSEHGWHCESGDYAATVEALLKSGAKVSDVVGGPNLSERCCVATGPRTNRRENVRRSRRSVRSVSRMSPRSTFPSCPRREGHRKELLVSPHQPDPTAEVAVVQRLWTPEPVPLRTSVRSTDASSGRWN